MAVCCRRGEQELVGGDAGPVLAEVRVRAWVGRFEGKGEREEVEKQEVREEEAKERETSDRCRTSTFFPFLFPCALSLSL